MQALTTEAVYRDEPPPISPVLVDVETPAEPVTLTERLALLGAACTGSLRTQAGGSGMRHGSGPRGSRCTAWCRGRCGPRSIGGLKGRRTDERDNDQCPSLLSDYRSDSRKHGTMPVGSRHPNAKLDEEKVREIKQLYASGIRMIPLAKKFGVAFSQIQSVLAGKHWTHVREEINVNS